MLPTLLMILVAALTITSLVCWIMTLIKMFQNESVLIGILGIICSLWAFIWGWMNGGKYGHKKVMVIWTAAIVGSIALQAVLGAVAAANAQ